MAAKPIPTWHAGILYRSRLEARWAVFFDQLDLTCEYESQGFVVDGQPYLPDFLIFGAAGMIWAEVKPTWDSDPEGVARFRTFVLGRPQPSRAVLLVGPPAVDASCLVIGGSGDAPWEDDTQQWRPCPSGYHFDLAYPGTFRAKYAEDNCAPIPDGCGEEKLAKAVVRAVSARFDRKPGRAA